MRNSFVPVGGDIELGIRLWFTVFRVFAIQVMLAIVGTLAGGVNVARPAFMRDTKRFQRGPAIKPKVPLYISDYFLFSVPTSHGRFFG
jgi:hypothetical protein